MDLESARKEFLKIIEGTSEENKPDFLSWIRGCYLVSHCRGEKPAIAHMRLRDIAEYVSSLVPPNAIFPSENIIQCHAKKGGDPSHTIHVDEFLYDSCDKKDLVAEGKLKEFYCSDCDSLQTLPLRLTSHSCSRQRLDFLFDGFLPRQNSSKVILDVGSRLGSVLYGAYCHSEAGKIIGVEMNAELCSIQNKVVEKFNLSDRIQVICNDIRQEPAVVRSADVIFINNPFQLFLQLEDQVLCWKFLAKNIKAGAIIVSCPSLKECLRNLKTEIDLDKWVQKRQDCDNLFVMTVASRNESSDIVVYDVFAPIPT